MSDEHVDAPSAVTLSAVSRNKGQNLVEAFRAARLAARPALRNDLLANRVDLARQRLDRLGRGAVEPARSPKPLEAAPPAPRPVAADLSLRVDSGESVFASYCGAVEAPQTELAEPAPAAACAASAPIPLSAIGFGPGMTMRMSQLGIESTDDLAAANAIWLRTALGDLSDLVHAELWIAAARKACAAAAAAQLPPAFELIHGRDRTPGES